MPYLNKCSMLSFFQYYAKDADEVTFVDTQEKRAFGMESEQVFSVLELQDIIADDDSRFIALYTEKEEPADAANTDEQKDG